MLTHRSIALKILFHGLVEWLIPLRSAGLCMRIEVLLVEYALPVQTCIRHGTC